MKQKYVYKIVSDHNGWLSVKACEVNAKNKYGFYDIDYLMSIGIGEDDTPNHQLNEDFLFVNENKTWWREPESALKALNLKLRQLYKEGKLPIKDAQYDHQDDYDTLEELGIHENDLF